MDYLWLILVILGCPWVLRIEPLIDQLVDGGNDVYRSCHRQRTILLYKVVPRTAVRFWGSKQQRFFRSINTDFTGRYPILNRCLHNYIYIYRMYKATIWCRFVWKFQTHSDVTIIVGKNDDQPSNFWVRHSETDLMCKKMMITRVKPWQRKLGK